MKSTIVAEPPDLPADFVQWTNADIEFPSTSTSDEIEIISQPDDELLCLPLANLAVREENDLEKAQEAENEDVFIAETEAIRSPTDVNESQPITNGPVEEEKVKTQIENLFQTSETVKNVEIAQVGPSAPAIEDLNEQEVTPTKSLYPTLKNLAASTFTQLNVSTKDRIIMQPFTSVQLQELYHNPEAILAEHFETDFIDNELSSSYKSHPLYDLIKKYSQSRYNLKVNMLDLQDFIKSFQQNSQNVWIMENRITSYEGVCNDGERIRKNELYE